MRITDLANMPRPPKATNGNDSVSRGFVSVYTQGNGLRVVGCYKHKAMLAVAITDEGGTIFRCPTCNVGAYRKPSLKRKLRNLLKLNN